MILSSASAFGDGSDYLPANLTILGTGGGGGGPVPPVIQVGLIQDESGTDRINFRTYPSYINFCGQGIFDIPDAYFDQISTGIIRDNMVNPRIDFTTYPDYINFLDQSFANVTQIDAQSIYTSQLLNGMLWMPSLMNVTNIGSNLINCDPSGNLTLVPFSGVAAKSYCSAFNNFTSSPFSVLSGAFQTQIPFATFSGLSSNFALGGAGNTTITWQPPLSTPPALFKFEASVMLTSTTDVSLSNTIQVGILIDGSTYFSSATVGYNGVPQTYIVSGFTNLNSMSNIQLYVTNFVSGGGTPIDVSIYTVTITITQM